MYKKIEMATASWGHEFERQSVTEFTHPSSGTRTPLELDSGTTTFKSWMEGEPRKEMWSEREESNWSTLSKELKKTSTCVLNKNK